MSPTATSLVVLAPTNSSGGNTDMTATGIPAHLIIVAEMEELKNEVLAQLKNAQATNTGELDAHIDRVLEALKAKPDEQPERLQAMILSNFRVGGALPLTTDTVRTKHDMAVPTLFLLWLHGNPALYISPHRLFGKAEFDPESVSLGNKAIVYLAKAKLVCNKLVDCAIAEHLIKSEQDLHDSACTTCTLMSIFNTVYPLKLAAICGSVPAHAPQSMYATLANKLYNQKPVKRQYDTSNRRNKQQRVV
jgi:hypothetical protein